jgi:HlyD family secretion protein
MAAPPVLERDLSVLRIDSSHKEPLPQNHPPRVKPWVYVVAAVIVVLAAAVVVSGILAKSPQVEVQRVAIEPAAAGSDVVLTAGGYIVAHHTIQVGSKVVGRVAWIGIEKGDRVTQGQVLVRLEDSEFRAQWAQAQASLGVAEANLRKLENGSRPEEVGQAQAAVGQAQAEFQNAGIGLRRTQQLAAENVASRQQLDNDQAAYDVAKAKLESAQKNFELVKIGPRREDIDLARAQMQQAQGVVDYAKTMLDATVIRSPIDGVVLERSVEKGEMVSTMNLGGTGGGVQASVASLADPDDLQVELDINQNDFPKISPKQSASITADAYPDRVYKGVVAEIAPEANRQKATIQVKVKVLEPDAYLRPEMNAHVSFLAPPAGDRSESRDALWVPGAAVVERDGKSMVFVLDGSRVRRREIHAGRTLRDRVEVLDGVGPNDRAVVRGADTLKPDQRVKVAPGG